MNSIEFLTTLYSYGEGFPFLRGAFLFGNSLYIWGMGAKEFRILSTIINILMFGVMLSTVWLCHYFSPYNGSYEYALDKTVNYGISAAILFVGCMVASLFITDPTPPTAWWDDVHVMD